MTPKEAVGTSRLPGIESQQRNSSLTALTGLRFFAAFAVVVYHFARPALAGWPEFVQKLGASGYIAVDFFFVLSGFVISYSYLSRDGRMRTGKRAFYAARFARIYPAYLLGFLLVTPSNIARSFEVNSASHAAAKLSIAATAALSLQQAWTPWTAWAWNYPGWSVSVEAFFYLLFPVIGPLLARWPARLCFAAFWAAWAAALISPALLYVATGAREAPQLNDSLQMVSEFTPLLRLPEFVAGILLGRMFVLRSAPSRRLRRVFTYGSSIAILCVLGFGSIPHPFLANGLLLPVFAMLIYGLAHGGSVLHRFLSLPLMVVLGEASYAVYILQIPVSAVIKMSPPLHSLAQFGLYSLVLIGAALLSWKFVECPARKFLREWLLSGSGSSASDISASNGEPVSQPAFEAAWSNRAESRPSGTVR